MKNMPKMILYYHVLLYVLLRSAFFPGRSPSPNFVYTGAGAELPAGHRKSKSPKSPKSPDIGQESKVKFEPTTRSPRNVGRGYPEKEPGTLPAR